MKKLFIVAAMVLGFALAASAQPRAIGLRGGYGVEVSYQHTLDRNFVELDLGLVGGGFNLAGTYNWTIAKPQWTDRGDWGVYAGPGAALGLGGGLSVAAAGQVGLEYTFWFPLQLSLDIRPQLGVAFGQNSAAFYSGGLWPTLGVRYKF